MEIKYTAKSFNEIWSYFLGDKKIENDEEIPQDLEFRMSYYKQKEFAENYKKYGNRSILFK